MIFAGTIAVFATGMSVTEVSALVGIVISLGGAIYTLSRFGSERRAGRIAEEDFYARMYKDLNETLAREIERLRREVADRDDIITRRESKIKELLETIDKLRPAAGA